MTTLRITPHALYHLDAKVVPSDNRVTLVLDTVWPGANHPYPHRLLTLTLPPDQLRQLAHHILENTTCTKP